MGPLHEVRYPIVLSSACSAVCMCSWCTRTKPLLPPINIQHIHCPYRLFILERWCGVGQVYTSQNAGRKMLSSRRNPVRELRICRFGTPTPLLLVPLPTLPPLSPSHLFSLFGISSFRMTATSPETIGQQGGTQEGEDEAADGGELPRG